MSKMETITSAPVNLWNGNPVLQALLEQAHSALAQAGEHTDTAARQLLATNEAISESLSLMGRESLGFSVDQLRQRIADTQALMRASNLTDVAALSSSQATTALQMWAEATRRLSGHWTAAASAYFTLTTPPVNR